MQLISAAILIVSLASAVYFLGYLVNRRALTALLAIILAALGILMFRLWDEREFISYPKAYLTRLTWLEGAPSSEEGMDCAKYIANAHGKPLTFTFWKDETNVVKVYAKRDDLREAELHRGDVANFNGQHVAVFLGAGRWIDADYRRGNVAKFRLNEKPSSDPWFDGPVTIRRFKEGVK